MATETIVKGPKHGNRAILVQEVDVVAGNVVPAPKSPIMIRQGEEHQFWLESNRALLVRETEVGAGGTLRHEPQASTADGDTTPRGKLNIEVNSKKKRK